MLSEEKLLIYSVHIVSFALRGEAPDIFCAHSVTIKERNEHRLPSSSETTFLFSGVLANKSPHITCPDICVLVSQCPCTDNIGIRFKFKNCRACWLCSLSAESSSEEEDGLAPESRSYTPSIDLRRFHRFVHEAENKSRTSSERVSLDQTPQKPQVSSAFDSSAGRLSELSAIRPLSNTGQDEHTIESVSSPVPSSEETRHASALPARGQRLASSQHPLHTSHKASGSMAAIQADHHHHRAPHGRPESSSTTSTGTRGGKGLLFPS